ncbi:hypothetical protein GX48_01966 [Paracoccidioides brasiliensis]|nr:hypothetical protein GX48_01966 [Paracoccidioides brasiliensis]
MAHETLFAAAGSPLASLPPPIHGSPPSAQAPGATNSVTPQQQQRRQQQQQQQPLHSITNRLPSSGYSTHWQPQPPKIYTPLNHYNNLSLPDEFWSSPAKRHRLHHHRHPLRHRDHDQQPLQQQRDCLAQKGDRDRAGSPEKRKHRHSKHHVSRDTRLPKSMREHANMSLRPGKYVHRERGRGGTSEIVVVAAAATTTTTTTTTTTSTTPQSETSGQDGSDSGVAQGPLLIGKRRENVTMGEVRRETMRRMKEEEANRASLSVLAIRTADINRCLDTTYYNLLEKISNLHHSIYSFHDLANAASTLHTDFTHETDNLDRDARKQIDDFQGFAAQVRRIESLEARMRASSQMAAELSGRMEVVRRQIEEWDRREIEWQARVGRRLRIFWAFVVTALVVAVVAWVVGQVRAFPVTAGEGIVDLNVKKGLGTLEIGPL